MPRRSAWLAPRPLGKNALRALLRAAIASAVVTVGASVASFSLLGSSYAGVGGDSLASVVLASFGGDVRLVASGLARLVAAEIVGVTLVSFGLWIAAVGERRDPVRAWLQSAGLAALVLAAYVGAVAHRHPGAYLSLLGGSAIFSGWATIAHRLFPALLGLAIVGYAQALLATSRPTRAVALVLGTGAFAASFRLVAWAETPAPAPFRYAAPKDDPIAPGAARLPNVLLVAVDSLRPDHIDAEHTPTIRALLDESLYFPNTLVTVPRTGPSWAAILTSLPPLENGVETMFPSAARHDLTTVALPAHLASLGYRTGVFSEYAGEFFERIDAGFQRSSVPRVDLAEIVLQSLLMRQPVALAAAVDTYASGPNARALLADPIPLLLRGTASFSQPLVLRDDVLGTIDRDRAHGDRPFFATVFYSQPHFPYTSSSPFYERYRARGASRGLAYGRDVTSDVPVETEADRAQIDGLYRGALAETDAALAALIAGLRARNVWDDTVVILTADHGEGLFDCRDCVGHGDNLTSLVSLRVPLAIRLPKARYPQAEPGLRNEWASQLDIYPTILAALGQPPVVIHEGLALIAPTGQPIPPPMRTHFAETGEWLWDTSAVPSPRLPYPPVTAMATLEGGRIVIGDAYLPTIRAAKHRAAIRPPYKLVYAPAPDGVRWRLYDVERDPFDTRDLSAQEPAIFASLQDELRRSVLRFPTMLEVDGFFLTRQAVPPEESYRPMAATTGSN